MGLIRNLLAPFAHATVLARLTSIEERLAEVELGWAETLDKLSHWAKRQAKRDRDAAKVNLGGDSEPVGAPRSPDPKSRKQELRAKLGLLRRASGGES